MSVASIYWCNFASCTISTGANICMDIIKLNKFELLDRSKMMKAVLTSGAGDPQVLYLGEAVTPAPPPQHVLIRYCRDRWPKQALR